MRLSNVRLSNVRLSNVRLSTMALSKSDLTLFKQAPIDIHQNNGELIRNACWLGSYDILKYLIQSYPEINIHRKNENAFKGACLGDHNNIEMAKLLLTTFPHINLHIDNDYIFKTACERNLLPVIELYIDRCPKITSYEDLNTGFLMAVKYNHRTIIDLLSEKYPSLLTVDSLYMACEHNHLDLVKWLFVDYRLDHIDYDRIFSMKLSDDLFLWLYTQGYYNFLSDSIKKTVLHDFIKKNQITICRMILNDHKELSNDVIELGTKLWSYDVSYTIYKSLDLVYLNNDLCTQAIRYCLKNNLVADCKVLMDRPNNISKLDIKLSCYEVTDGTSQTIKPDYYEIVELMASKNEIFLKMYRDTLSYNIRKYCTKDDLESFIFYIDKYHDGDRYLYFLEACRYNSLSIVQWLCRGPLLGKFRIPEEISLLIVSIALNEGHRDILQYLYCTYSEYFYSEYSNEISKEISLVYDVNKELSPNMVTNVMWLICRYPDHKMKFEALIRDREFKIVDQPNEAICIICKISHDQIIRLPCGHHICFDQICHFRVEAGVHNICLACRKSYSWKTCVMYNGKKSKFFPFRYNN